MTRCLFIAACILLVSTATRGQEASTDSKLESEVRRLVLQLDDNRRSRRETAEQALIKLGPEAMPFFPQITPRTSAEVKERLGRVRKTLELEIASKTAAPSLVTLQGEMTAAKAFEAIEQQTGNRIVGYGQRGGTVTVDFKETPYWEAFDKLLDDSGLKLNAYGGESDAHVLMARPSEELPPSQGAMYSGVFRFEPTRLESRRDLRNPAINGMQLTVTVGWEPRIRPISLQQSLANMQAVDDQGQELAIDQGAGRLNASGESGITAVEFRIPLGLPERGAKQIASLKGVLDALVPGSVETFEFTDLAESRDVQRSKAGVKVIFERLRRNQNVYEARVRIQFENASSALQSHYGWVLNNEAYLLDAKGQRINNAGLRETRRTEGEVGVAYVFVLPAGPKGCKFVYKTPATILRLPVEYEITNIDLP